MRVPGPTRRWTDVLSRAPRSGEFFAPLPLAAVGLLVVNDNWLKPALHDVWTGKLSGIAVCFFLPLFISELLGLSLRASAALRLLVGGMTTLALYTALELYGPCADAFLSLLEVVGPWLSVEGPFRLWSDVTDLWCLACVPLSMCYGGQRLGRLASLPPEGSASTGATIRRT